MPYDGYTLLIMMIITSGKEYKDFRYAADTFIDTVNKWGIRDESYTKEELYGMLRISEVTIASDGEITVYYTENTEEFGDFAIEIKCSANSEDIITKIEMI